MPSEPAKISRRRFGHAATLAMAGLPLAAAAQTLPPPSSADEVETKHRQVLAQYGERLDAAQKARVRAALADHVRMLETVRAYSLANSDPPATALRLVTGGEGSDDQ